MSFHEARIIGSDYPTAEYLKEPMPRGDAGYVMSRHSLLEFYRCPWRWVHGFSSEGSDSKEFGSLVDALVSGNDGQIVVRPNEYEATDGGRKPWNMNSKSCRAWVAEREAAGLQVVSERDYKAAEEAAKRLEEDADISDIIRCSEKQVRVDAVWRDEVEGMEIPIKTLLDFLPDFRSRFAASIVDLKTTHSAHPGEWGKSVERYGYDVQAAFFLDVFNAVGTHPPRCEFRHVLVENYPPFAVGKRILSAEFVERGRSIYRAGLSLYARCLKSGKWPGYDGVETGSNMEGFDGWTMTQPKPWQMEAMEAAFIATPIKDPEWMKGAA